MPFRRAPRRARRRAPMRRKGARRVARKTNMLGSISKVYNYKVNLLPEYLTNHGPTPAGALALVTDQPTPAPLTTLTQGTPDAAASGFPGYYSFGQTVPVALADLQRYSQNFTTQYDQYRINSVTLKITYLQNSANSNTEAINPTCYAYVDYDDSAIPANAQGVIGRQGVRRFNFNDRSKTSYSVTWKPRAMAMVQSTSGTPFPAKPLTGWLDCNQPTVNHNGLKLWWENVPLAGLDNTLTGIQYEFVYNISCKGPINAY